MTNDPITGVYELGHALHLLDANHHGFDRGDIESVECFWTFDDLHTSSAGFVLRLRDGGRAYLDFLHWHAFEQDEDFRIEIEFLPYDKGYPTFASADEPLGGWLFTPPHLEKQLAS